MLTLAQKKQALTKIKAPQAEVTVRDFTVAILGSLISETKRFGADIVTQHRYSEAVRRGQL